MSYDNWAKDADRNDKGECVSLSFFEQTYGKWYDESCNRKGLTVCQKKQTSKIDDLMKKIEYLGNNLDKLQQKFDSLNQTFMKQKASSSKYVPIDFIYTQFPNQSEPGAIWPKTNWTDVTSDYAGLFFRAEGSHSEGKSEHFGYTQNSNQSRIIKIAAKASREIRSLESDPDKYFDLIEGVWSNHINDGSHRLYSFKFFTSKAENRPRNTAIRIWKRVG